MRPPVYAAADMGQTLWEASKTNQGSGAWGIRGDLCLNVPTSGYQGERKQLK